MLEIGDAKESPKNHVRATMKSLKTNLPTL